MGLDITHLKLTITPNEESGDFTLDDWEVDCNVPLSHYSKYITMIDDLPEEKTIVIVKNNEELEILQESIFFMSLDSGIVLVGEINNEMEKQILKYSGQDKLNKFKSWIYYLEHREIHYHSYSFEVPIKTKGFYYDDVAYQRKGMNSLFYSTFKKRTLWGNLSDFELAYSCIGDEWYQENWGQEAVDKMKRDFKANFLDTFEFGRSLLCVTF